MSNAFKVLGIIGVLVVVIGMSACSYFVGGYNKMVALNQKVDGQWSQVENVYQRRFDLIPNLVATVKGYAAHENAVFTQVTEARAKVGKIDMTGVTTDAEKQQKFFAAQGELSSALSRLMVVQENYPQLKANENFLELQNEISGTENRVSVERRKFGEAVQEYNTTRATFPLSLVVAGRFPERKYYKADEGAEKAPKVVF